MKRGNLKSIIAIALTAVLSLGLVACGGNNNKANSSNGQSSSSSESQGQYKDGEYKAEATDFDEKSGYKATIDVKVEGGKITSITWDAVDKDGNSKRKLSEEGKYGMVEKGKAQSEWHEQAKLVEDQVMSSQSLEKVDAITGVSINTDEFFNLIQEALKDAK